MRLTKEQWMDVIEDIEGKVLSCIRPTSHITETPADWKLHEILFAEMEHCIGLDGEKPYKRAGRCFYMPYRNYYDAGYGDSPMWEALVEKGFAWCKSMYHLTLHGIYLLRWQTGICIYNPSRGDLLLRDVTNYFIARAVDCSYGCWLPVTKKEVKRNCFLTKKQTDWAISKLLEEGWIIRDIDAGKDGDGFPYYRKGFMASAKLEETEEYKKAWKEECDYIEAMNREGAEGRADVPKIDTV